MQLWESHLATYLQRIGVVRESKFHHFVAGVLDYSGVGDDLKLIRKVYSPLVRNQLCTFAILSNTLWRRHKQYLCIGTNVDALQVLLPPEADVDNKVVSINVPGKDKAIVDLDL